MNILGPQHYGQCEDLIKMMDKINSSSFEYIRTDISLGDSSEEEGIRAHSLVDGSKGFEWWQSTKQEQVLNAAH